MPIPTVTNTPHPRGQGFALAIDDTLFRPAYGPGRELQIETAPLQEPSIDTRQNPEEMTEGYGRTFARDDFTGGEGLDRAHTRQERVNADSRFYDSRNIDISEPSPGETREIRLLHATELVLETTVSGSLYTSGPGGRRMAAIGGVIYTPDYDTGVLRIIPNVGPNTTEDPHAGQAASFVSDVTAFGAEIYAAIDGSGIHRRDSAGTWTHYSDLAATRVYTVKNRLMATDGESIYEVVASGAAPAALYTLPDSVTFADVIDGDGAILAGASDGYVYAFGPDDTGALELKAQTLIPGEAITALGLCQDFVFVGTRDGITKGRMYRTELADDFTLVNRQLIREWSGTNMYPSQFAATRENIYTAIPETDEVHAWRYDVTNSALSRSYVFDATPGGSIPGVLWLRDRLTLSIIGAGVYQRADTYATSGYLIGPLGDFFTSAIKSWVGARLDTAVVDDGAKVELLYTTDPAALTDSDADAWVRVKSLSAGTDTSESAMAGVTSRWIAGQVRLTATSDATDTPAVRSFAFRAYPGGSGSVDKIISIPVNVSDQLEAPNRRSSQVKGWGAQVYDVLRGFEGQAVRLRLYRPDLTLRGLVESVGAPIPAVSERGSPTLFALVRFRGRETSADSVAGGAMGVGGMGVTAMGT